MFKVNKLFLSLSLLSAASLISAIASSPALAFSFNSDGSVGISLEDIGKTFDVNFDGNVATKDVAGLSSSATFTFLGFAAVGQTTEAKFDISLKNTSSGGITSRTSALGFNIDLDVKSASVSSGGLFSSAVLNGSLPNNFGAIDVCFTDGNNCQGGGNGGVSTGENAQSFKPTVTFNSSNVTKFALSNFGVRYQSITGTKLGTSGTGQGTVVERTQEPSKIPEPSTLAFVLFTGLAILPARKKASKI